MRSLRGFSLLEMVVTLVVGMLVLGLVGVSFNSVLARKDRLEAENALDRVVSLERSWDARTGGFSLEALEDLPADLSWTTGASGGPSEVSVELRQDGNLALAVLDGEECLGRVVAPASLDGAERQVVSAGGCSAPELS